jgi:TonB-dependent starch-binding outer membrane protein SusC
MMFNSNSVKLKLDKSMEKNCKWECFPPGSMSKIFLRMKLLSFFVFISMVASAANSYSQLTKFNLKLNDVTVREVFQGIEQNSEFILLYNEKQLDVNRRVSVTAENESVESILDQVFKGTKNTYKIYDRQIVILSPGMKDSPTASRSKAQQEQTKKISGKVTDQTGAPMPGVSVVIKGTATGVSTEADGTYSLSNVPENATLVFSFLGMKKQEINTTGQNIVNVEMAIEAVGINEVVVTGVGVATSKRKLGISVESVNGDKLPQLPTATIDQALVGKIPGAQLSTINGTPGAPINILLRGINSINQGTLPMIMLDGIQVAATNLNALDLSTVDRVEVVEGAASATIYGAQGANGVIQIFTKKGARDGKINIDISSSIANSAYLNVGGVRKAKLHGFVTDANNNVIDGAGNPLVFNPEAGYENNLIWLSTDPNNQTNKPYDANLKYYDHFKMFFTDAYAQNNSITISGGQGKLDAAITLSNNHQQSNLRYNGYLNRTNLVTNIGFELASNLKFRSITQLINTDDNIQGDGSVIGQTMQSRPFADYAYKDPDGNHIIYFGDAVSNIAGNALYMLQYHKLNSLRKDAIQTFNLNYKPFRFLELDAKYGFNYQKQDNSMKYLDQRQNKSVQYYGFWLASQNGADASGEFQSGNITTTFQNLVATATVHLDFQKDFNLKVPVISNTQIGYDYRKNDMNDFEVSGIQMPEYTPFTRADAASYRVLTDYTQIFTTYGYLVNQKFDWGDLGGISGGFRSDYSSAFGAGSKPFTFPRGDVYFRLSALNFWNNGGLKKVMPEFKIRSAYGEAGIQPGAYDRYITLNPTPLSGKIVFTTPITSTNPSLDVEVSKEFEVGSDITFDILGGSWLNTANLSVTYWKRTTDNSIWPLDVVPSTGLGGVLNNSFGLKSNGWQASLNLNVLNNKNLTWNFTTNFSKQTSEISSVKNDQPIAVRSSTGSAGYVLIPGYKIGQLYGYIGLHAVDAIDATTGEPYIPVADQNKYEVASNGWVVETATKLPYYTSNLYPLGDPNPTFNAAFINEFTYKGFLTLSMQWDWINGAHLYNQSKEWMYRDGVHSDYEKPITIDGETGAWSAFYRGQYAQISRNGTRNYFYEDASFMRLRDLIIACDFAKLFQIKGVRKLQLVLTGHNLITVTNYTGMDPETSSGPSNSSFDRGVDSFTMPNLRTYQVGVNLGF